jgi:hypothetical protein
MKRLYFPVHTGLVCSLPGMFLVNAGISITEQYITGNGIAE